MSFLRKFDIFCMTAPLPQALLAAIAVALACAFMAAAFFGMVPPPPIDVAHAEESSFVRYVDDARYTGFPTDVESCSHMYRDMLDGKSQRIYDEIEQGVRAHSDKIVVSDAEDMAQAFAIGEAVLLDNPDIFWVSFRLVMSTDSQGVVALHPLYTLSPEEQLEREAEYEDIFGEIVAYAKDGGFNVFGDDDAAMNRIVLYIANMCSHGNSAYAASMQDIGSVLSSGESVCAGYAKTVCYAARKAGIPCVVVQGTGSGYFGSNGKHAWVAAYTDGQIKLYDPYWYDMDIPLVNAWRWVGRTVDDLVFTSTHINSVPNMEI